MADDLDIGATRRADGDFESGETMRGLHIGQRVFGRFVLEALVGRGGMGMVYRARDEELGRTIALKFLPDTVATDEVELQDLKRETRRSLELTHPHIVRVYDFMSGGGLAAISMEYIDGATLKQLRGDRTGGHFEVADLVRWVGQACEALEYAHTKGRTVHRDLKPANLMVDAESDLRIADFGISATLSETSIRHSLIELATSGTPVYMSPQQMMGEKPAVTDDVYSLGATLFELLTGKPPFYTGRIEIQVMQKMPPTMAERRAELGVTGEAIPAAWEQTVAACLAKEAGDRPQSSAEVWRRLDGAAVEGRKSKVEGRPQSPKGSGPERPDRFNAQSFSRARAVVGGGAPGGSSLSSRRKTLVVAGVLVTVAIIAVAGWWFGVEQPKRRALEAQRLAVARAASEAEAARLAKEKADAEAEAQRIAQQRAVEQAAAAAEAARLANARGGVIITTEPSGAEVTVGGFAREKTPATLKDVKLGKYPVIVSLAGYEEQRVETEVRENEFTNLRMTLVRSTGSATMASNPPGLEVEVQPGVGVGGSVRMVKTPAKLEALPTGDYTLTYRREGWPEQTKTLTVERNATASVLGEFLGGGLDIRSTPSGAEVWSQGKRLGVTPLAFSDLMPGNFDLEFRLKGYLAATQRGQVVAKQTERVAVTLEEQKGPQVGQPYENSLGMKFVPVPGTGVLFSIWETRVADFEAFVKETGYDATAGMYSLRKGNWGQNGDTWKSPGFAQSGTHPVVGINEGDAKAFCGWLTKKERAAGRLTANQEYRLPTDGEWDAAVGPGEFPWGDGWPPPRGAGNYAGSEARDGDWNSGWSTIEGYSDGYARTSPVGSFAANRYGIYDLGGNVWERVEGRETGLRGASFGVGDRVLLASSFRIPNGDRNINIGFRVVCVVGAVR